MESATQQPPETTNALDTLRLLLADDMQALNQAIHAALHSSVPLIDQLARHLIDGGGKRLRPMLLLAGCQLFNYRGAHRVTLAAIIEFIHAATLLHDDVVDASQLRHGQPTANRHWGNEASVLVGDFLYSRAFQLMVEIGSMSVMDELANVTNRIAEAEVRQLTQRYDTGLDEHEYLCVIRDKTACLFEAAGRLAALIAARPAADEQALADYCLHLGMAYQLIDDVLDYDASAEEMGKNPSDDLKDGGVTMPLLYALRHSKGSDRIRAAIKGRRPIASSDIASLVAESGALDYTAGLARREAEQAVAALANLPPSLCNQALVELADFVVCRRY